VFGFDVLKPERMGSGFGIPTITPLFVCSAQVQSLEVADAQLAAACRVVMEQHLMGHEIKSGIHPGSGVNPKPENRRPKETRNPNEPNRHGPRLSSFELPASSFLRISGFGFRA
jgi:hypothetical protein